MREEWNADSLNAKGFDVSSHWNVVRFIFPLEGPEVEHECQQREIRVGDAEPT
jgi:hypothetical protein